MSDAARAKAQHEMREAWQAWADEQVREQTAALREENARLQSDVVKIGRAYTEAREALAMVSRANEDCGECDECEDGPCELHAVQWGKALERVNALLDNPEGQRAGMSQEECALLAETMGQYGATGADIAAAIRLK